MKNKFKLITSTTLISLLCIYGYQKITTPTISVVMPVYNRADLLPRAIDSILNQTYKDFELIIVDDASTDTSAIIAQQYAQKDNRIKLFINDENKGISFSRNKGMDKAKGKYIAIMDSDDQSLPFRLEKSIKILEENPKYVALSGTVIDIKDKLSAQEILKWNKYTPVKNNFAISFIFNNTFPNAAAIFKKSFVQKHNIRYNESYISAEDYDFWKQFIFNGGELLTIYEPFTFVRYHFSNSNAYYEDMLKNSKKIHQELISRFFIPEDKEIQVIYPLDEKCALLEKIETVNKQKQIVPQEDISFYKNSFCPPKTNEKYYITDSNTEDYIYKKENKYIKLSTGEEITLKKENNSITIQTKDNQSFTYKKHPQKNVYTYLSNTHYKVIHNAWSDTLIQQEDKNIFCRSQVSDCGTLLVQNKNMLKIKWEQTSYPIETFIYDPQQKAYVQQK